MAAGLLPRRADAVVLGAGIAGLASAYHLLVHQGLRQVVVADPRPPLSGTSARSTECYRNFFDTAPLVAFMNRSIDGMETHAKATDNMFHLTRRGYAFVSTNGPDQFRAAATAASRWGAGDVRVHAAAGGNDRYRGGPVHFAGRSSAVAPTAWENATDAGFDLLEGRELVGRHFPYVTPDANAVLHARRCGWVNAHLYGTFFLEQIRQAGGTVVAASAEGVELAADRLAGVRLRVGAGTSAAHDTVVSTNVVVNATGAHIQATQRTLDPHERERQALHIHNDLHAKISFRVPDRAGVPLPPPPAGQPQPPAGTTLGEYLAAVAPMFIWSDTVQLPWTATERAELADAAEAPATPPRQRALFRKLLGPLPSGLHFRPYGRDALLALWEFVHLDVPASDPPSWDLDPAWEPSYAEIVQRGLSLLVPSLADRVSMARVTVDGGHYCHAHDDHFLIGPRGPQGVYLCGGLRGVGIMSAEVRRV